VWTIRRYHFSDAAVHDSHAEDELLMRGNTASGVWADAVYRSEEIETKLKLNDAWNYTKQHEG